MRTKDGVELDILLQFLLSEFPKRRLKPSYVSRKFIPAILISSVYTNKAHRVCPFKSKDEIEILYNELSLILVKVFGFEEEINDIAIFTHLGLY